MTALPDWDIVSDAELACAAAAGDRRAFASIYDRYADRLHDFCIGMLRDREAAADCVQDVFCHAATRLSQLREADKLRPWLYAIARNEALRCIRSRNRERTYDEVPETESGEAGPDTLAARSELANLIAEAAGGLSDRDRSVLELAYRHGLDGPELAEALGVSAANAKKMTQRLRETIERSLGALLVSRRVRSNPAACPELGEILDGWDGQFSVLMRKRIARHIESCAVCDEERSRLVNPVALLGGTPVFIPAPAWLRDRTLDQINLTASSTPIGSTEATQTAPAAAEDEPTALLETGDVADAESPVATDSATRIRRARDPRRAGYADGRVAAARLECRAGQRHQVAAGQPAAARGRTVAEQPTTPGCTVRGTGHDDDPRDHVGAAAGGIDGCAATGHDDGSGAATATARATGAVVGNLYGAGVHAAQHS